MQTFRIENRTIFKILIAISVFIGVINLLALVKTQLIWIASAFFLALAINPLVQLVRKYMPNKSRGLALFVTLMIGLILAFIILYSLVPKLIEQSVELIEAVPKALSDLQNSDTRLGQLVAEYDLIALAQDSAKEIFTTLAGATGSVVSIAQGIFSGFAAIITIVTLSIFMLIEGPRWNRMVWEYHPKKNLERNKQIAKDMYFAISSYFTGILFIAAISAAASTIMMSIVGVPYAVPLGLLVGLFGLIPYVGATIAAVMVCIVALFTSTGAAIAMAIYFIIYQQIENNVIQPIVQGKSTELSPLIVTIAILIGASVAGIFGAIVAIPIAACIKVLIVHYFTSKGKKPIEV